MQHVKGVVCAVDMPSNNINVLRSCYSHVLFITTGASAKLRIFGRVGIKTHERLSRSSHNTGSLGITNLSSATSTAHSKRFV